MNHSSARSVAAIALLAPAVCVVRALAPGVYFVREAQDRAQAQAVQKVVVTK